MTSPPIERPLRPCIQGGACHGCTSACVEVTLADWKEQVAYLAALRGLSLQPIKQEDTA
jgi:hypothetical protein